MTEPTLWGIHAGQAGDAHALFLDQGVIALGWNLRRSLEFIAGL